MEGHLRGIIGQLTVEQIVKSPKWSGDRMRTTCAGDMNKMGLEVISFTIKEVRDKNEYITNMGRPDIARIKRDADVAAAEAERDTAIKRARSAARSSHRQSAGGSGARARRNAFDGEQAEASAISKSRRPIIWKLIKRQQAQADKAYEIQTNVMQQQVMAEQVKIQQIEKEHADQGAGRRNSAPRARADRDCTEAGRDRTAADRNSRRRGEAALDRRQTGRPQRSGPQGEAEAEIIFKKGEAEAKAMNVKAEAYQEYNQAAVVDKLHHEHAGNRQGACLPLGERRQDHHRFDGRERRGHEQDHRRHGRNGRADSGAV